MPKTADIANITASTPPSRKVPTQPSGEMRKSSTSDMRLVAWKAGAALRTSRIGANEIETRTDITTKSVYPDGSARFRMPWAAMMPTICTIM